MDESVISSAPPAEAPTPVPEQVNPAAPTQANDAVAKPGGESAEAKPDAEKDPNAPASPEPIGDLSGELSEAFRKEFGEDAPEYAEAFSIVKELRDKSLGFMPSAEEITSSLQAKQWVDGLLEDLQSPDRAAEAVEGMISVDGKVTQAGANLLEGVAATLNKRDAKGNWLIPEETYRKIAAPIHEALIHQSRAIGNKYHKAFNTAKARGATHDELSEIVDKGEFAYNASRWLEQQLYGKATEPDDFKAGKFVGPDKDPNAEERKKLEKERQDLAQKPIEEAKTTAMKSAADLILTDVKKYVEKFELPTEAAKEKAAAELLEKVLAKADENPASEDLERSLEKAIREKNEDGKKTFLKRSHLAGRAALNVVGPEFAKLYTKQQVDESKARLDKAQKAQQVGVQGTQNPAPTNGSAGRPAQLPNESRNEYLERIGLR